jgi:hypothetical protein
MPPRRTQPNVFEPSITPERAYTAIKKQLASLQAMRSKNYIKSEAEEEEWKHFTHSIVERTFGPHSSNVRKFSMAKSAGDYFIAAYGSGVNHGLNQRNFEARIQALESFLKACLAELELIVPESEITGTYEPGDEYEFYRDIKSILSNVKDQVLIVDPYLSRELFDLYADGIDRSVQLRILTNNLPSDALAVAQKYATGGNLRLRTTNAIHDRAIFADDRVWMVGQSLKDAAKKKPTYIVEHDAALARPAYEDIWGKAQVVI